MAKWVKLPDGAQVTMGREEYESSQSGIGVIGWVLIIGAVFLILNLWPEGSDNKSPDQPRPSHTISTPHKGDGS
jgi:hypothetical protein